ncbi:MAG TPA: hypothetical protein VJY15_19780 [Candidatus Acidoferrum sp.]|nr:hypothetical protein [Candidatus Acidoferrum sp.]
MKRTRPITAPRVLLLIAAVVAFLAGAPRVTPQVSPNEILDPDLKALEKQYFSQLKSLNQSIARLHFPFPFYLSRYVGIEPAKQAETDSRGLEFVKFRDRTVLKITGNYDAAYSATQFTRNERAARTFQDVLLPILQTVTQGISPDVACDAIGFEVAYHTRAAEKSYDYEGKELLVIVVDRQDAFVLAQATNDTARQDILNRSMVFLGGQEFGLSLLEKDPYLVSTLPRTKPSKPDSSSTGVSSTTLSRLNHPIPNTIPSVAAGSSPEAVSSAPAKPDLSQARPVATQSDVDRLQAQYQAQLDTLSKEGQAKFQFVDYDPPAFVVISKQLALQMTLRNNLRFDIEKSSIYKRAAQTFDLFLAPKLKDLLDKIPNDSAIAAYDFSVVNPLTSSMGAKERSEAVEFILPAALARQFADNEITNQALIDKSQVLVNGVRIALNLQLVE